VFKVSVGGRNPGNNPITFERKIKRKIVATN
jgi:hypothetical protein